MSESQAAVGSRDTASTARARPHGPGWPVATVGALGVVFGDIGTSPIYTIQTIFNPDDPHPVAVSPVSVYGLLSLVFWSVTIIVTILYIGLVLRADNEGEGGILSLITLLSRGQTTSSLARSRAALAFDHAGHLRGIVVSCRQHDHPGHLGALGRRGAASGAAGA